MLLSQWIWMRTTNQNLQPFPDNSEVSMSENPECDEKPQKNISFSGVFFIHVYRHIVQMLTYTHPNGPLFAAK